MAYHPPGLGLGPASGTAITTFALEPDVPRDPLAAAESADWARARHLAVLGLPVDPRAAALQRAVTEFDAWLRDGDAQLRPRGGLGDGVDAVTGSDLDKGAHGEHAPADELPETPIELSADEVAEAAEEPQPERAPQPAPRFAQPQQFATAETIVLSGPEIKRKIRHKQSVMPSYAAQILYEDIGALFEIGDREGALISLERLLTVAPITPQIDAFLDHNQSRLLDYYATVLGPWTRTARLREGETAMPTGYFAIDKVAAVVKHLDGTLPLDEVMARSGLRRIEACAVLSQLARSASLELGDKN